MADDSADAPASTPLPFVTAWAVDDEYRLPDDLTLPRDRGLVEVEVLRDPGDGTSTVVVRWTSRDHFAVHRRWLSHRLGLGTSPRVRGTVGEVRRPPTSWRKRLPIYGLAMGLLGFFGTLELAQARYGLFFGAPDVAVQIDGGVMVETVTDEPVRFELSAVNHSRVTTANVGDLEVRVRPAGAEGAAPLAETRPAIRLGPIDPGARESADVEVEADLVPGIYSLDLEYAVKGGMLLPSLQRSLVVPARVWPFLHTGQPYLDTSTAAQTPTLTAWVHLPVQVGPELAAGLECLAELAGEPGLTFIGVDSRDVGIEVIERGRVGSGSAANTFVQWRTSSLGPREERSFLLGLSSEKPRVEWTGAVDRVETYCEPRGGT